MIIWLNLKRPFSGPPHIFLTILTLLIDLTSNIMYWSEKWDKSNPEVGMRTMYAIYDVNLAGHWNSIGVLQCTVKEWATQDKNSTLFLFNTWAFHIQMKRKGSEKSWVVKPLGTNERTRNRETRSRVPTYNCTRLQVHNIFSKILKINACRPVPSRTHFSKVIRIMWKNCYRLCECSLLSDTQYLRNYRSNIFIIPSFFFLSSKTTYKESHSS